MRPKGHTHTPAGGSVLEAFERTTEFSQSSFFQMVLSSHTVTPGCNTPLAEFETLRLADGRGPLRRTFDRVQPSKFVFRNGAQRQHPALHRDPVDRPAARLRERAPGSFCEKQLSVASSVPNNNRRMIA
jgi:hypothetical protein